MGTLLAGLTNHSAQTPAFGEQVFSSLWSLFNYFCACHNKCRAGSGGLEWEQVQSEAHTTGLS